MSFIESLAFSTDLYTDFLKIKLLLRVRDKYCTNTKAWISETLTDIEAIWKKPVDVS